MKTASGAQAATLSYDPLGRLHQVTAAGKATQFLYSGDSLISEYQAGLVVKRHVFGDGVDQPLLSYTGSGWSSSAWEFQHANHQGSIIASSDVNGNIRYTNTYDAYGVSGMANQGSFGYTGQLNLPGLDLQYYKARIYSPSIGRFLQTDPIGYEDQMNLYGYVGNDPMNLVDPTGECSEEHSGSAILCNLEDYLKDKIEEFLDEVIEDKYGEEGGDFTPEEERDPEGIYAHESDNETVTEEVIGVVIIVAANRVGAGPNDRHGDGGRAGKKAEEQIKNLEEKLAETTSRSERNKIKTKIQNIRKNAQRKAKGEEHGRRRRR